jgi:hypothetical protein
VTDLDLIRDIRAEVPAPAPARLAAGRTRLLRGISPAAPCTPSSPGRRFPARVLVPAGAVAAAAAIAGGAIVASGPGAAGPAGPAVQPPVVQLTVTARLLSAASATLAREPAVRPGMHQWIYSKFVEYDYGHGTQSDENWIRFDGRQSAYFLDGRLIVHTGPAIAARDGMTPLAAYNASATPLAAYNALASLPSNPKALLAAVGQQAAALGQNAAAGSIVSVAGPASRGELEFDYLAQLLWNAAGIAPPAALAAVFRAMAAIPGVSSQHGIRNVSGQPAVGLSASGGQTQLLLDPSTYQVNGMRQLSTGQNLGPQVKGHPKGRWPAKGGVVTSMAWAQVVLVAGPGRR